MIGRIGNVNNVLVFFTNAGFSISSICICVCILFAYFLKNREKKLEEKSIYFVLDLCAIIVMCIVEIIYVLYFIHVGSSGRYANMLYYLYSITILITTFFSWVFVISYRVTLNLDENSDEKNQRNKYIFYSIIAVIEIIIAVMIFVMPVSIEQIYGVYTFVSVPITTILVYVLLSTTSFVFFLYYKNKTITKRDLYPSIVSLILICLLLVYRLIRQVDINIETFQLTLFVLGVFFTVENQDYKLIALAKQKQETAQSATTSQQEFLANVAHGIRSPMNTILGLSQLLLQEEHLTQDKVTDDMKSIHDASTSLITLIHNITDYSYLISDKGEVAETEYDVQGVLFELNNEVVAKITNSDVSFNFGVSESVPSKLIGDSEKISKVLSSVISHAISYTSFGQITLDVKGNKKDNNVFGLEFLIKTTSTNPDKKAIDIEAEEFMEIGSKGKIDSSILNLQIAKDLSDFLNGKLEVIDAETETRYIFTLDQKMITKEEEGKEEKHEEEIKHETVEIDAAATEPEKESEEKEEVHEETSAEEKTEEKEEVHEEAPVEEKTEEKEEFHEEAPVEEKTEEKEPEREEIPSNRFNMITNPDEINKELETSSEEGGVSNV